MQYLDENCGYRLACVHYAATTSAPRLIAARNVERFRRRRKRFPLEPLQLLPRPPDATRFSTHGSGDRGLRLGNRGIAGGAGLKIQYGWRGQGDQLSPSADGTKFQRTRYAIAPAPPRSADIQKPARHTHDGVCVACANPPQTPHIRRSDLESLIRLRVSAIAIVLPGWIRNIGGTATCGTGSVKWIISAEHNKCRISSI